MAANKRFNFDKNSPGYIALVTELKTTLPLDNISNDPNIPVKYKRSFSEFLRNYDKKAHGSIVKYCREQFFWKKDSNGIPINQYLKKYPLKNIYSVTLGRVTNFKSFKNRLYDFGKQNGISLGSRDKLFSALLKKGSGFSVSDLEDFDPSISMQLTESSYKPMWSYKNKHSNRDPYYKVNKQDLPCILGLANNEITKERYDQTDYLTFGFILSPQINVYKPTSFDAEFNEFFKLGGTTQRHLECLLGKSRKGFEEFIHEQVTFSDVKTNLFIIKRK